MATGELLLLFGVPEDFIHPLCSSLNFILDFKQKFLESCWKNTLYFLVKKEDIYKSQRFLVMQKSCCFKSTFDSRPQKVSNCSFLVHFLVNPPVLVQQKAMLVTNKGLNTVFCVCV